MPEALLAVRDLEALYGDFQALFGVSIEVARGEAVAVIGANGAGKSTLLKSIAGLLRARPDAIVFAGKPIGGMPAYAVAARGIALVPPIVVREIYARLPAVCAEGTATVVVEQDVVQALAAASRVYCLQEGRVALSGAAKDLTREAIAAAYFGV
jgi:ABC-type branched-subunit amino acid transport system ATPase component